MAGLSLDQHVGVSDPPQDIDRHIGSVALQEDIDLARANAQRANDDPIHKIRQRRSQKADLLGLEVEVEAEAGLQQRERRGARPWPAANRRPDRASALAGRAPEPAEQFCWAAQVHIARSAVKTVRSPLNLLSHAIPGEAEADERIVARPDRSRCDRTSDCIGASEEAIVLIPQPVKKVGPRSCSATAAALSCATMPANNKYQRSTTALGKGASARRARARRCRYPRTRTPPEIRNPEIFGLAFKFVRAFGEAAGGGHLRREALRGEDITLHLAERDRTFRVAAVGVEMESAESFAALVGEAGLTALIFDEPVPVAVAVGVDPMQRGLNVRPQPRNDRQSRVRSK